VLYLFEVIHNQKWPPWPLIGRDIFSFFFHITVCEITRFARNIPLGKFCYFWELFEIQDGCTDLWLTWCILYFFSNAKSQDLPEIFLWEVLVLFGTILDSRQLLWFMICWDITHSKTSAFQVIGEGSFQKCCYFSVQS
jgi:hypothetical protein